jgi:hypothetical protein
MQGRSTGPLRVHKEITSATSGSLLGDTARWEIRLHPPPKVVDAMDQPLGKLFFNEPLGDVPPPLFAPSHKSAIDMVPRVE